jgi:hypothetical protein
MNSVSEKAASHLEQGCQMAYFQTKNPNLGKFWRVLQWKMLVYLMTFWSTYFTAIGNNLWPFGIFCSHLVYFPVLVWCTKKNLATLIWNRVASFSSSA